MTPIKPHPTEAIAAKHYLSTHPGDSPCRFDVIALDKDHQIQWVKDAFNAG